MTVEPCYIERSILSLLIGGPCTTRQMAFNLGYSPRAKLARILRGMADDKLIACTKASGVNVWRLAEVDGTLPKDELLCASVSPKPSK